MRSANIPSLSEDSGVKASMNPCPRSRFTGATVFRCALLLMAIAVNVPSGTFVVAQVEQLYGGKPIKKKSYRWFTAVIDALSGSFICSAALIGSRHVLTAYHCVENRLFSNLQVSVGYLCPDNGDNNSKKNCGRPQDTVDVFEYRRPLEGDIAVIVLQESVRLTEKRILPAIPDVLLGRDSYLSTMQQGDKMRMIGAGRDGTRGGISARVKSLQVKHIRRKKCIKKTKNQSLITALTTCSVSREGKPCAGDSGAAIVVKAARDGPFAGREIVVAIHNFGPRDCSGIGNDAPIGHSATSAAADFIRSVVCGAGGGNNIIDVEDWCAPVGPETIPRHVQPVTFGTTRQFGIAAMPGDTFGSAEVALLPQFNPENGLYVDPGFSPKGGGRLFQKYTLIWDVFIPAGIHLTSIIQTDTSNESDGDFWIQRDIHGNGLIGANRQDDGPFPLNAWSRIVVVWQRLDDANVRYRMDKWVNAVKMGNTQIYENDWRTVKNGGFLLFADDNDETPLNWAFSSFAFIERAMTPTEVVALGGVSVSGPLRTFPTNGVNAVQFGVNGGRFVTTFGRGSIRQ